MSPEAQAQSISHEPEVGEGQVVFMADYAVEHSIREVQQLALAIDKSLLFSKFDLALRPFKLTRGHMVVQAQDRRRLVGKLFSFKKEMSEGAILAAMAKQGMRPATENEALSLYRTSPHLFVGKVCSLGSYYDDRVGRHLHLVIDVTGEEPELSGLPRDVLDPRFPATHAYLAVRAV